MADDETEEIVTDALNARAGERLGTVLVILLETVARTHPDLLRDALGKVLDLSKWEAEAKRIAATVDALQRQVREVQQILADCERRIGRIRTPN